MMFDTGFEPATAAPYSESGRTLPHGKCNGSPASAMTAGGRTINATRSAGTAWLDQRQSDSAGSMFISSAKSNKEKEVSKLYIAMRGFRPSAA